jgi:hypothetical protein
MVTPRTADKWKKMPRGWTEESRTKMWQSLVGDSEHKVTECIRKMDGNVDNPGAFCAALADRVEGPEWRKRKRKTGAVTDIDDIEREIKSIEREKASLERDLLWGEDAALERKIQQLESRIERLHIERQEMEQGNFSARFASTSIPARLLPRAVTEMIAREGLPRKNKYEVHTYNEYQIVVGAGYGSRAIFIAYNMETDASEKHVGAWGGGALGVEKQSLADDFSGPWWPMQDNVIVVKGTTGAEKTISLTMSRETLDKLLSGSPRLASANLRLLAAHRQES